MMLLQNVEDVIIDLNPCQTSIINYFVINSRQTYVDRFDLMSLIALLQHRPEQRPTVISKVRSANKEENSHRLQRPYIQNARVIAHRNSCYRRYECQYPKNGQHTGCP